MKAYTDLSQSKKLAEILPLESADMCYINDGTAIKIDANSYSVCYSMWKDCVVEIIPCWSLSALLDALPNENMLVKTTDGEHYCLAKDVMTKHYDNPVDACYEVIVKLKKKNLL
jgi:hypothetical protein